MSDEQKELLARIGQLAGQINRHKNQRSSTAAVPSQNPYGTRHRNQTYRSAPYYASSGRGGYRAGRPTPHHHRTLNLNPKGNSNGTSSPAASTDTESTGWVSKTDRHRQLINASVYEKQSQSRTKAIEATRQRKLQKKYAGEKSRFNAFLQTQNVTVASVNSGAGANLEISIEDIKFIVRDGGKKLVRSSHNLESAPTTPKTAIIAGVRFHRTKTGNLVANRVMRDHRRYGTIKKTDVLCKTFSTTGSCPKGPRCRYTHDAKKVALCKEFLRDGECVHGNACDLSHDLSPERLPNCVHFAKGNCVKPDCPYTHSAAAPNAPVCEAFGFRGYCEKGASCRDRHVFECPDFSNTGKCSTRGCKLLHRERASMLRKEEQSQDEEMNDISSDDDTADSDDVDSDAVAEFMGPDSDDSDVETGQDFIAM
ncbi:hypothetical protein VHEMI06291 [[Torrubiella] hemipterigena]|uniref:C3H1-type domain-containing protein n=1 Tax=[Torrubiella] hemipterigena TaxID=1531966 RepID=A0A0A1TJ12_9HYPO|nr:hypothetical protein VHEMI06291 [[Torrubiella] hemipterigena]